MFFILFGLPGSGKTYTGKLLAKQFDFYFYDGDESLPVDMRKAINSQEKVTDEMRDRFFADLARKIGELRKQHPSLVVAQTYIKEKYREQVLEQFPDAKFILIESLEPIREMRLMHQNTYPLALDYVRRMVANFDVPVIPHTTLLNNTDGERGLLEKLALLLGKNQ